MVHVHSPLVQYIYIPVHACRGQVLVPYDLYLVPQPVDFGWNAYADPKFEFMDHSLVACIRSQQDHETLEFFKLLSLCHTVMVEHKEGEEKERRLHAYTHASMYIGIYYATREI